VASDFLKDMKSKRRTIWEEKEDWQKGRGEYDQSMLYV
jgi:hypothetical protein